MWWLQPGWTEAICPDCGKKIWPEGDPDWGRCAECFQIRLNEEKRLRDLERLAEEEMNRQYEESLK